jgi:uncharacterized protein (TIGR00369 family)
MIAEAVVILRNCNREGRTGRIFSYNLYRMKQPRAARKTASRKNLCFACGPDNPGGMHLKFVSDPSGRRYVSRFRLNKRYTGPPGHCHGGIIATILDDAMSKLNKLRDQPAATARTTVEYLKPVPLHKPLRVESREISKRGRRLTRIAEIFDEQGTVLARGRGVFVLLNAGHAFRKRR